MRPVLLLPEDSDGIIRMGFPQGPEMLCHPCRPQGKDLPAPAQHTILRDEGRQLPQKMTGNDGLIKAAKQLRTCHGGSAPDSGPVRVQQNGHRAVVAGIHFHIRPEFPVLDLKAPLTAAGHEVLVERDRHIRFGGP